MYKTSAGCHCISSKLELSTDTPSTTHTHARTHSRTHAGHVLGLNGSIVTLWDTVSRACLHEIDTGALDWLQCCLTMEQRWWGKGRGGGLVAAIS